MSRCTSRIVSSVLDSAMFTETNAHRNAPIFRNTLIPQLSNCSEMMRPEIAWKIAGALMTIIIAMVIYWFFPTWKIRREHLERISSPEQAALQQELVSLAEAAVLPAPPVFVWNPLAAGLPLAFGHKHKYCIRLSGSFVARYFFSEKGTFRAIMLHELAHIRNSDIPKTYCTLSLWLAFLVVDVTPAIIISVIRAAHSQWVDAAQLLFFSGFWIGIVTLLGLAVLRARECYADVQASVWDRSSNLDVVLSALPTAVSKGWLRYFRFHPDSAERRATIEDPSRLFPLGFADAFGIGVTAWFVSETLKGIAVAYMPSQSERLAVFYISINVLALAISFLFAVGAVGIGVWRQAFASLLSGDKASRGAARLGGALAAGLLTATLISSAWDLLAAVEEKSVSISNMTVFVEMDLFTAITGLIVSTLVFIWISDATSAWLEFVLKSRSPWPILILTIATSLILVVGAYEVAGFVVLFSFFTAPWKSSHTWIYMYDQMLGGPVLFASVALWAFPLSALLWRKRVPSRGLPNWVFFDGSAGAVSHRQPLRVGGALMTGIVMGLIFLLVIELIYFREYFPFVISGPFYSIWTSYTAWTARTFGDIGYAVTNLAMALQALGAAIVTLRARWLNAVCGLFAATIAGGLITAGDYLFFLDSFNRSSGLTFLVPIFQGTIIAMPVVAVATWTGKFARQAPAPLSSIMVLANSSSVIADEVPAGKQEDDVTRRRTAQGSRATWPVVSKGCFAALCLVVGLGIGVRAHEEVLAAQEAITLRASAERGDAAAQNKLGSMYARGQSITKDDAQAVFWFRKAAEQGYADAENNLGLMYLMDRSTPKDDHLAFQWFHKAAEQGYADAENNLGTMYSRGWGVPRNDSQALQWFLRAATQGYIVAQDNLGIFYALGRGTPRDDTTAVKWLGTAAERGYADAQYNLGIMYQQGRALPKDSALALRWFRKAAQQGHAGAQYSLGEMYESGGSIGKDDQKAIMWFQKSARQGYPPAKLYLQVMCKRGIHLACTQ